LRRHLALAFLLLAGVIAAGCVSGPGPSPYANAVMAKNVYDVANVSSWTYAINMSAGGTSSAWNMTVNNTRVTGPEGPLDDGGEMYMTVGTVGNGMDVLYDVWWNATTYQVDRMHAKGWIGDYYQDRNVSTQQILTLPDTGLNYYFVPLQYAGTVTIKDATGKQGQLGIYTATDNSGFRVTYWAHPAIPLPVKIEMSNRNFNITMMLINYTRR